ncbi:deoxyribonuclease V [Pedobacter sp. SYSU D00535]|uniref:deoxyribonuclease V n=1 Tax=Pedobacter sp. SYSU D00535 TaxID=2810308 RepID=UPI001A95B1B2|nr:deoxyribonuclease V [Pedobacter sp. SYSU D00535]
MSSRFYNTITPTEAVALQKELQKKVRLTFWEKEIKTVGGADISFNKYSNIVFAGIVVLQLPDLKIIEQTTVTTTVDFPYIPGLLAFREMPALLEAWNQLQLKPDVLVTDGHGVAHPRRLGIASNFGITTNTPTLGCAKTLLTGSYSEPPNEVFGASPLTDKGEQIGTVLRTKRNCKPVFISAGHLLTHEQSVDLIKRCSGKYRIPEPTRLAHLMVNEARRNG